MYKYDIDRYKEGRDRQGEREERKEDIDSETRTGEGEMSHQA